MPIATNDLLLSDDPAPTLSVALEPAHNVQHSLLLLARADEVSGFDEWVYRTAATMTPEERDTNQLVMIGFHYAVQPRQSFASFPLYVEHLATVRPAYLRDKVLDAYVNIIRLNENDTGDARPTYDAILADVNIFLAFLRRGFGEHVIPEIERQAYTYLLDPPALQQLIVGHLRAMWYKYLAVEWERVRPMLQKAVRAFDSVDLNRLERSTAAEYVLGQPLKDDKWCHKIDDAARVTFVPSAHVGPYTARIEANGRLWILFGARQPQDAGEAAPELTRAELLVRLSALADDTRLSILRLVAEQGELRSQDVIGLLDLSQSGASRHLQQLSAAGFLSERRCNGAKCYHLNGERVDNTLAALGAYLAQTEPTAARAALPAPTSALKSR
ncbi:MAG: winged helix-turn-helix transcriptional regulator [Candidatus Promineofilum sp.]|nr:winged helix-turn-helix transcriptional regulator [Promineifilum sp.]